MIHKNRTITTKTKPFIPKWKLLLRKNPLKQSIKVLGMVGVSVHQSILRRVLRVSLKAWGGEGERGWDGWMASLTQRTWVWINPGSWWWTGRPGMQRSTGLQRVRHAWATELNWTEDGRKGQQLPRMTGAAGPRKLPFLTESSRCRNLCPRISHLTQHGVKLQMNFTSYTHTQ